MGNRIVLTSSDGFRLGAYRADPDGQPRGAVVVIQEIFGVNAHIRDVCEQFAGLGYVAIAPALFDRIEPDFESGYTPEEVALARKFVDRYDWPAMLADTQAAIDSVQSVGPVSVVGYCLGGTIAFLAATRLSGLSAAVGYYGGSARFAGEQPHVPTQLHFAELDQHIPLSDVDLIRSKRSEVEIHVYEGAVHGFNCDQRASYHKPSADLSRARTMAFLAEHASN